MRARPLFAALLAACAFPSAAFARTVSFTVDNATDHTIVALYSGPSTSEEWGSNFLNGFIEPGQTIEVTLGVDECDVDFRFEFKGAEPKEIMEVDACKLDGGSYQIN